MKPPHNSTGNDVSVNAIPSNDTPANAAIHYNSVNYSTSGKKLMGKDSANENFLRAFVKHSGLSDFYCFSYNRNSFDSFSQKVRELSGGKSTSQRWISPDRQHSLSETGCLYVPAPQVGKFAWERRQIQQRNHSICGLTHTISSSTVMQYIGDLVTAPTQEWDALICTSNAVVQSLTHVAENYSNYMAERFNAPKFNLKMQLPVIPLGVDANYYTRTDKKLKERASWRKKLNIKNNDIVILFNGRLSMHAKAHPGAMYIAAENAAQQTKNTKTKKTIHLLQSGWFDNDGQKNAFIDGAKKLAPSVNHILLDGRKSDVRDVIYFIADIFTSLSDNIQETFGLTPLEAMAAGLPVVVTDWNGYKDTVRHNIDGIMVPTTALPAQMTNNIAHKFESEVINYDNYIGEVCQLTSVDINKCTEAYIALIEDETLRKRLGNSGRKRAVATYDWQHIIRQYQSLWQEMALIRKNAQESARRTISAPSNPPSNPLFDSPMAVFANYPTKIIANTQKLTLNPQCDFDTIMELRKLPINDFCFGSTDGVLKDIALEIIDISKNNNSNKNNKDTGKFTTININHLVNSLPYNEEEVTKCVIWLLKVNVLS